MYAIFTYIYNKHQPNVGKYTIHGSYGKILDVSRDDYHNLQVLLCNHMVRMVS